MLSQQPGAPFSRQFGVWVRIDQLRPAASDPDRLFAHKKINIAKAKHTTQR